MWGAYTIMITLVYFMALMVSVFTLCAILIFNKKIDSLFIGVVALVCTNMLGRYLIATADSMDMAIWATKVMYVGSIYCPVAFLRLTTKLCDIVVPDWIKIGLVSFATVVMSCVSSIGTFPLYYREIQLCEERGCVYLEHTYGPTHILYPILILICVFSLMINMIMAIKKRNEISARTIVVLCLGGLILEGTYFIEKLVDTRISYVAIEYLFAVAIMGYMFTKSNMYDITSNITQSVEKLKEYGYIELDEKNRFIAANDYMRDLFPEIRIKWHIDVAIPNSNPTFLYREIYCWAIQQQGAAQKTIKIGDSYYEMKVSNILHGRKRVIGRLIELIDRTDEVKYTLAIKQYNQDLKREVQLKTEDIMRIKDKMVIGLAMMIDSRDNSTGEHIKRSQDVVKIFLDRILQCGKWNISEEFADMIYKAAPMHDLGKIAVEDRILRKRGGYTKEEYEEMKRHSEEGARIVREILHDVEDEKFVEVATNVAHYHHEQWDGKGYPMGMEENNIPIEARIMALADAFDALVSRRCYKEAYSCDMALDIISRSLGTHFDPELGRVFLECRKELAGLYAVSA